MTILSFSKAVHPVYLEFKTVQLLQCKTPDFLSPRLWSRNGPELNSIGYKIQGVIQQHENVLQVTRLNKLNQQLAEV